MMPSIPLAITALLEQRHGRLPAYRLVSTSIVLLMTGNHWWKGGMSRRSRLESWNIISSVRRRYQCCRYEWRWYVCTSSLYIGAERRRVRYIVALDGGHFVLRSKTNQATYLNETNKREELEDKIKLQRERMQQAEACNSPCTLNLHHRRLSCLVCKMRLSLRPLIECPNTITMIEM